MKNTTVMAAAVLALLLPLGACDGTSSQNAANAVGAAVERVKSLLGVRNSGPGVVATVDGAPIYLRQVEGLYDMNNLGAGEGRTVTLDEVRADYAECLRTLIVQTLIRRELAALNQNVSAEDILRMEETVSSYYDERPGPDFDHWIEDAGLVPDLWREQLRARLELERWQAELSRSAAIGEAEVEAYIAAHPDEMEMPAHVEYLLVIGRDKARVEAMRQSRSRDLSALRAAGLEVRHLRRSVDSLPDILAEELSSLALGGVTDLRQMGGDWQYALLLSRQAKRPRTPAEMYTHAEQQLMEKRLPEVFDAWLADTLAKTHVRMVTPLMPHNAPRPAPPPPPRAPLHLLRGLAGSDAPEALEDGVGEVEADNEP
ncbi:MAG: peptidyl-prolyl cis-trans isomerase [Desulfovibrionaceae bacterium]|nr:peptidyl-prolyl cis-trans isomerase [Desulfovibrionaceae bacterium]